ncbi:hypothetical protein U1Q18_015913, partial [Sarracenia purpurea var. burkii]
MNSRAIWKNQIFVCDGVEIGGRRRTSARNATASVRRGEEVRRRSEHATTTGMSRWCVEMEALGGTMERGALAPMARNGEGDVAMVRDGDGRGRAASVHVRRGRRRG